MLGNESFFFLFGKICPEGNPNSDKRLLRALAGLNISIPNANMRVVQIDGGNPIEPSPAVDSIGVLYPGERIDIVLSSDQTTSLAISLDEE